MTSSKYDQTTLIARGGMGEVMKAWDASLDRWVALKFLLDDDPKLVRRLQQEARAQARIEHPNVCRVYEVGDLEGRPYIAMQYIEGQTLEEAAVDLSLEQKIQLLRTVAEAVHAAHRVGLIHRDLKPKNILVETTDDGEQVPYVVDFGIASHRDQDLTLTAPDQIVGTPGYLAPEQAQREGREVDRRADVFSLGVILYELLTRERPFQGDSSLEVLVALLQKDPAPPRRIDPNIPGDLETIALCCLEKEPSARYGSARAVADELGRYLDGWPIEARPVGPLGRLRRRAKRHPWVAGALATATALVLVLGVLLVLGGIKYTLDLRREKAAAVAAREEAELVASYLVSIFETSDPDRSRGQDVTARQLLERGAERARNELGERPLAQARMLHTIGRVQRELGLLDAAEASLQAAVDTRGELLGDDAVDTLDSIFELAVLRKEQGNYDDGRALARRVLDQRRQLFGDDSLPVARSLIQLGNLQDLTENESPAPEFYRQAIAILESLGIDEPLLLATALNNLARVTGDEAQRTAHFTRALALFEEIHGRDHPKVATVLHNLGSSYRKTDLDRALELLGRSLDIRRRVLGPKHPYVAYSENNFGMILFEEGRMEEAGEYFRRAKEIADAGEIDADSWFHSVVLYNLGLVAQYTGRYAEAEEFFRRGTDVALGLADGQDSHYSVVHRLGAAQLALDLGRPAQAEQRFRTGLAAAEKAVPDRSIFHLEARMGVGKTLNAQGRHAEAEQLLRGAVKDAEEVWPVGSPSHRVALGHLATTLLGLGRADEALALVPLQPAAESLERPRDRYVEAGIRLLHAEAARDAGDDDAARSHYRAAADLMEIVLQESTAAVYRALMARALLPLDDPRGEEMAQRLLAAGYRNPSFMEDVRRAGLRVRD